MVGVSLTHSFDRSREVLEGMSWPDPGNVAVNAAGVSHVLVRMDEHNPYRPARAEQRVNKGNQTNFFMAALEETLRFIVSIAAVLGVVLLCMAIVAVVVGLAANLVLP